MSKRASPTTIGAFVVGAVALLVVGLVAFGSMNLFRRPVTCVMFFDSTVSGLSVGADVEFRGVKLGQVSRIESRWGTEWIAVYAQLDLRTIRGMRGHDVQQVEEMLSQAIQEKGLRAQLRWQNFITGQLFVALDLFPKTPIKLAGLDQSVSEIPVVSTTLQLFTAQAEKLLTTLQDLPLDKLFRSSAEAMEGVKTVIQSPDLQTSVRSAAAFLTEAEKLARRLGEDAGPVMASLKDTSDAARVAVTDVSQDARRLLGRVEAEVATLSALMGDAQRLVVKTEGEIGSVASSVKSTSEEARATLEKVRATLGAIDGTADGDSRLGYQLVQTLQDLGAASRSLRDLADYLERHPEALLRGKGRPGGN
jgi:phospholipid/cholesterol/gamma-HCH transport system substrate-binding protein